MQLISQFVVDVMQVALQTGPNLTRYNLNTTLHELLRFSSIKSIACWMRILREGPSISVCMNRKLPEDISIIFKIQQLLCVLRLVHSESSPHFVKTFLLIKKVFL